MIRYLIISQSGWSDPRWSAFMTPRNRSGAAGESWSLEMVTSRGTTGPRPVDCIVFGVIELVSFDDPKNQTALFARLLIDGRFPCIG